LLNLIIKHGLNLHLIFLFDKDNKHTATFQNTTSTNLFHKLSNDTEEEFMKLNNTETKNKYKAYYFYRYFKAYLTAATKNDEIIHLNKHQAIQKLTSTPINTYHHAPKFTYSHEISYSRIDQIWTDLSISLIDYTDILDTVSTNSDHNIVSLEVILSIPQNQYK
ncbi:13036_t:CDS:2, partial [Gigaspora rosea]